MNSGSPRGDVNLGSTKARIVGVAMAIAAIVVVIDQVTKAMAILLLSTKTIGVIPFLNLRLGFNRGVSFGLFASDSEWAAVALIAVTSFVILAMVIWLIRVGDRVEGWALGGIIGGALGNLVDRIRQGAVTDFIDVYIGTWHTWHWPTFNIADVAITCGAGILLLAGFLGDRASGRRSSVD